MFRRILVPVDRGDENSPALRAAEELAAKTEGEVVLLHVIETIQDVPFAEMKDFYEKLKAESGEMLIARQRAHEGGCRNRYRCSLRQPGA